MAGFFLITFFKALIDLFNILFSLDIANSSIFNFIFHQIWSTWRESNPYSQLGKLVFYH